MTYFISICSGKGGVGKSVTAINLSYAMKHFNKNVVLLDNNLTSPNIGLYLGLDDLPITLNDCLKGKNHATEAIYTHGKDNLKVLPSSISLKDLNVSAEKIREVFLDLKNNAELVILDNSGGLNSDVAHGIMNSNEVLIVTNPDIISVTGALRCIKFAENLKKPIRGVVLSRVKNKKDELTLQEVEETLGKEVIAVIHEDDSIRESLMKGSSIVADYPNSKAAIEYKKLAARIIGEKYEEEHEDKKEHVFANVLKFFGIRK